MDVSDTLWFRLLAGVLLGLALGSFTTMLAYRVPRKISIVKPPSHCPNCSTPLRPRDLIPIFSWVSEGGKCRHCGRPIGARYVVIELATTAAVALVFVMLGFQPALLAALVAIVTGVALVTIALTRD